jgi:hypothetical protein
MKKGAGIFSGAYKKSREMRSGEGVTYQKNLFTLRDRARA